MRRIAYLVSSFGPMSQGVFKKVVAQATTWMDMGYEVRVFVLAGRRFDLKSLGGLADKVSTTIEHTKNFMDALFSRYHRLLKQITDWDPDIVYARQILFHPLLLKLWRAKRVVCEINSDDLAENRLAKGSLAMYKAVTRRFLLSRSAGLVFVTKELSRSRSFTGYTRRLCVIGNGIDLSAYEPSPPAHHVNSRLVFIGAREQGWHGLDKIAQMANQFPSWEFDLVGPHSEKFAVRSSPNIRLHGNLERSEYDSILSRADIGIGTLSLHVKGMEEASSLKVREYLAYGLPCIIGYVDTDFPEPVPFILQLPNTPDNVLANRQIISDFVNRMKGTRVPRSAVEHLDVRSKESKRIEFFKQVLES